MKRPLQNCGRKKRFSDQEFIEIHRNVIQRSVATKNLLFKLLSRKRHQILRYDQDDKLLAFTDKFNKMLGANTDGSVADIFDHYLFIFMQTFYTIFCN